MLISYNLIHVQLNRRYFLVSHSFDKGYSRDGYIKQLWTVQKMCFWIEKPMAVAWHS